jgi:signal transduction histidine kinase/CheY-like chemotaxis protein
MRIAPSRIRADRSPAWFALVIILYATNAFPTSSNIGRGTIPFSAGFYCDASRQLDLERIASPQYTDSFSRSRSETPNFGFTKAIVWVRLSIPDTVVDTSESVVMAGVPGVQSIDCYGRTDSGFSRLQSGFLHRGDDRAYPSLFPAFCIPPSMRSGTRIFYLRCESKTALVLPLQVLTKKHFDTLDRTIQNWLGFYFGALCIIAVFHVALFGLLGDRTFFLSAGFISTFGLGQMVVIYGYGFGQYSSHFATLILPFVHCIQYGAAFFALLCSMEIIAVKRFMPTVNRACVACTVVAAVMVILSPVLGYRLSEQILVVFNIVIALLLFFAATVSVRKNYRPAKYYIIASVIMTISLVLYNLMYGFGLFPFSYPLYFAPNVGFIGMILLFSLALTDRISLVQRERARATEVALANLQQNIAAQKEVHYLGNELLQARKLEVIGKLFAGICHDLKNYLTPLYGYAQMVKRKASGDTQLVSYVEKLLRAAHKTRELAVRLLDFGYKHPFCKTPCSLEAVVDDALCLLRHAVPKNIEIRKMVRASQTTVSGDAAIIQNALMNIGLNACDAMPGGGTISITIENTELAASSPLIERSSAQAGWFVTIRIADSGRGIEPHLLENIFDPFFTTKPAGKGTGLGLAGVKECVRMHGGCIEVDSAPGRGAVFSLHFPCSDEAAPPPEEEAAAQHVQVSGAVLLVDNEELVRSIVIDVLTDYNVTVTCAPSIEEGVRLLESRPEFFCGIFIDCDQLGRDPSQGFARIRAVAPHIPIVALRSGGMEKSAELLLALGCTAVLEKPFDMTSLLSAVATMNGAVTNDTTGSVASVNKEALPQ